MNTVIVISIIIALLFNFLNGMNDAANSIATIVSTKVLSPVMAVLWAAFFNFVAVFFFGVHIATTIGKDIVDPSIVNEYIILGCLLGSIIWVYACTYLGMPISVSHALIGGLMGPALVVGGTSAILSNGLTKVVLFIFLSPLIGIILSYFIMLLTMVFFKNTHPRKVDRLFRVLQLLSSAIFSLGHGSNDAQKTMGIITILLFSTGKLGPEFYVPNWVLFTCYITMALGTLAGGKNVIRTLGSGLTKLKPVQGFSAETAGAIAIIGSTLGGIPVSTTHTITGAIMGVGLTKRVSSIRWGIASNIIYAWIFTIPGTMLLSGGIYYIISLFLHGK
ncbi:MAG: inorganic phosphate transporter [Bacteroidales bacterium]|nr:inorganic phosphate transporter [Bacteroidales bacterium]MCB9012693.1 inorganic phosphate transporter [Bacteroidales bacterium]